MEDPPTPPPARIQRSSSTKSSSSAGPSSRPRRVTHSGMTGALTVGLDIRRLSDPSSQLLGRTMSSVQPLTTVTTDPALPSIARPSPALMTDMPTIPSTPRPHAHASPRPRQSRSPSIASLARVARGSDITVSPTRESPEAESSRTSSPSRRGDTEESLWAPWERLFAFANSGNGQAQPAEPVDRTSSASTVDETSASPTKTVPPSRWASLFGGKAASQHAREHAHPEAPSTLPPPDSTASEPPSVFFSKIWASAWSASPSSPTTAEASSDANSHEIIREQGKYTKDRLRDFKKPKHPLVLCHGLLGWGVIGPKDLPALQISYWRGVREALEEVGVEVLVASVPTTASIEERARTLAAFVEQKMPGRTVNLVGHSMGGLDCRFLTSQLKPTTFKVASVTTIATPHRGSSFADYLLYDVVSRKHLPKLLNLTSALSIPGGGAAYEQLTVDNMARFNASTPDVDGVAYFSYGAAFEPGYTNIFRLPWSVIWEREGPNDGLVSVESSKWGAYQGTLENVNHLDLIGWIGPVRFAYADWTGKKIDFKPVSFFLDIANDLASKGL